MYDEKREKNDWGLSGMAEMLEQVFGDEPGYISSSDLQKVVDDVKKQKFFMGQNLCELHQDRILLPIKGINEWAIAKFPDEDFFHPSDERRIVLTDDLSRLYEEVVILEKGPCHFDEHGMWLLPASVLELIDSIELTCLGVGAFAELMTCRESEKREAEILEHFASIDKE